MRELNEQIEKQKRHEAEYARWQKVNAPVYKTGLGFHLFDCVAGESARRRASEGAGGGAGCAEEDAHGAAAAAAAGEQPVRALPLDLELFFFDSINGAKRYKEWKASHNTELAKVRRQAKQVPRRRSMSRDMRDCVAG